MTPQGIALFGASGRTGRCVIHEAQIRRVPVRGLVRTRGSLADLQATEVVGSLQNGSAVDEVLEGCFSACLVFGPHPPYTDRFCATATEAVLAAAIRAGVTRVVCQTGAMIGDFRRNRTRPFQLMANIYQRRQPEAHQDRVQQEELIRSSPLEWTLIKPPRLTTGPMRPRPAVGPHIRVGLLSSISRRTLAQIIVTELVEPRFPVQNVFVRA